MLAATWHPPPQSEERTPKSRLILIGLTSTPYINLQSKSKQTSPAINYYKIKL